MSIIEKALICLNANKDHGPKMYAAYYKNNIIKVSKRRVYLTKGACKAQIIRYLKLPMGSLQAAKDATESLLKGGILEIRSL